MKEIILCKYGELVLKGANKSSFESRLTKELRRRAWHYGAFEVHHACPNCLKLMNTQGRSVAPAISPDSRMHYLDTPSDKTK